MAILTLPILQGVVQDLREQHYTFAHAHGCFDLLHVGHILHLIEAKKFADYLVVTVTADAFVDKGSHRPAFHDVLRAQCLDALRCVDFVTINYAANAVEAIGLLRPNFLVKGPECLANQTPGLLAEQEAISAAGGELVYTTGDLFSSTELLNKVLKYYA